MILKFGAVVALNNKNYVYLESIDSVAYLAQILDKGQTKVLLSRYQKISSSPQKSGNPVYKIVKLSTKEFEDMGAHCYKTGKDASVLEVEFPIISELNSKDKKAIIDELLIEDGFVDNALQEKVKDIKFQ